MSSQKQGASVAGSVFNLINNIIGSGLLVMPWAMKQASLVTGCVLFASFTLLNGISFLLLTKCCQLTGLYSYLEIGKRAWGPNAGRLMQLTVLLYTLGSCISYVVLIGDFIPAAFQNFKPDLFGLPHDSFRALTIAIIAVLVFAPLSFVQNLSMLKPLSFASTLLVVYVVGVVVVRLSQADKFASSVKEVHFDVCVFAAAPVINVAFTAHYNAPRYFEELENRSMKRMTLVVALAFGACASLYLTIAVCGYLLFGAAVEGDILKSFATDDNLALIARIALACVVSCSFPLAFHSLRTSVYTVFLPSLSLEVRATSFEGPKQRRTKAIKRAAINLALVTLVVGIGLALQQVQDVLAYSGSLFGAALVFTFPALLYLKIWSLQGDTVESLNKTAEEELMQPLVGDVSGARFGMNSRHWTFFCGSRRRDRCLASSLVVWGLVMAAFGSIISGLSQAHVLHCRDDTTNATMTLSNSPDSMVFGYAN